MAKIASIQRKDSIEPGKRKEKVPISKATKKEEELEERKDQAGVQERRRHQCFLSRFRKGKRE